MIKYAVEKINPILVEEIQDLLLLHWEEIAMYKDKIVFDPDFDIYYSADEIGSLHIVTIRDDGKIIGYFISFVNPHPHYKNNIFALNDILFIHKNYRGSTAAYRMFKFAEKELKKIGASVMIIHMKIDFLFEPLCQALGMDKHEISYSKYLGD